MFRGKIFFIYRVFFLLGHPKKWNNFTCDISIALKILALKPIFLAHLSAKNHDIWTNISGVMSNLIFSLEDALTRALESLQTSNIMRHQSPALSTPHFEKLRGYFLLFLRMCNSCLFHAFNSKWPPDTSMHSSILTSVRFFLKFLVGIPLWCM